MQPRRKPAELDAVDLGDALVQAERGDRPGVRVHVVGLGAPPRSVATMLSASRLAWRTACCALGPQSASGSSFFEGRVRRRCRPRSTPPRARRPAAPPCTAAGPSRRPAGRSGGQRVGPHAGGPHDGLRVEASRRRDRVTRPSTIDSTRVFSRMSMPRSTQLAGRCTPTSTRSTSGRMRPAASTSTHRRSRASGSGRSGGRRGPCPRVRRRPRRRRSRRRRRRR